MSLERLPKSGSSDLTTLLEIHRNELGPEVRTYADNLYAQIQTTIGELGAENPSDFERMVRSGIIPPGKISDLHTLMGQLTYVLEKNAIPFIENDFMGATTALMQSWEKAWKTPGFAKTDDLGENLEAHERRWLEADIAFIDDELKKLPPLPVEVLMNDERFGQRLLEQLYTAEQRNQDYTEAAISHVGIPFSLILNHTIRNAPPETRALIKQEIDVASMKPNYTGAYMEGGHIIATKVADYLGLEMKGGKIEVQNAENRVGHQQSGGEIYIDNDYEDVSDLRTGKVYFQGKEIG